MTERAEEVLTNVVVVLLLALLLLVSPVKAASEARDRAAVAARAAGLCFSTQATLWVLFSMVIAVSLAHCTMVR